MPDQEWIYPVTLEEVKLHLNIIGSSDDAELKILIAGAVDYVQGIVGRDLITGTVSETLRLSILMSVAFFYENRGEESGQKSEPVAAKNLALRERHTAL